MHLLWVQNWTQNDELIQEKNNRIDWDTHTFEISFCFKREKNDEKTQT